jgi:aminoglycoside phosphotransferase (APT) family kinase protein
MARLQQPAVILEVLRPVLPADLKPTSVTCTPPQSVHSDRFVMRAQLRSNGATERAYALKVYSDDFGQQVWAHSQALAEHHQPNHHGLCLPQTYLPQERALIFPWVDGLFLSEIVDDRKPELLRQAARLAADLHRKPIVPEQPTTTQMFVAETRVRCDRLRKRWPETAPIIEPLIAAVEEASTSLDPADPAPVHGDMAAGQFLWTGKRLVLLDLDMFGYTDPAYDAGHFLAQLERRCLWDRTLPAHASQWRACFRDAYLAAMPRVSARNVSFYQGLTFVRKIYTIYRKQFPDRAQLVPQLATAAQTALQEVLASGQGR